MKYCFLLPAYKTRYFSHALSSILNQTYTDFNVIVSDDCSPEDIKIIVDDFNDPRVKYRRNDHNIGGEKLVEHWNILLSLTDAEYVIMASDDDVYAPEYLEEINRLAEKYPQVNVLTPRVVRINSSGSPIAEEPSFSSETIDEWEYMEMYGKGIIFPGIPQYAFKRSALISINGFVNFPLAWFSDDATVAVLAHENKVVCSNKPLSYFRVSDSSISGARPSRTTLLMKLKAASMYINFMKNYFGADNEKIKPTIERAKYITEHNVLDIVSHEDFFYGMRYCVRNSLFDLGWLLKCTYRYCLRFIQ